MVHPRWSLPEVLHSHATIQPRLIATAERRRISWPGWRCKASCKQCANQETMTLPLNAFAMSRFSPVFFFTWSVFDRVHDVLSTLELFYMSWKIRNRKRLRWDIHKNLISSKDSNDETIVPMPPIFAKHVSQILKQVRRNDHLGQKRWLRMLNLSGAAKGGKVLVGRIQLVCKGSLTPVLEVFGQKHPKALLPHLANFKQGLPRFLKNE